MWKNIYMYCYTYNVLKILFNPIFLLLHRTLFTISKITNKSNSSCFYIKKILYNKMIREYNSISDAIIFFTISINYKL